MLTQTRTPSDGSFHGSAMSEDFIVIISLLTRAAYSVSLLFLLPSLCPFVPYTAVFCALISLHGSFLLSVAWTITSTEQYTSFVIILQYHFLIPSNFLIPWYVKYRYCTLFFLEQFFLRYKHSRECMQTLTQG